MIHLRLWLCHHICSQRFARLVFATLLAVLLSSCNSYLADGVRIAWAKQLFQQGNYQESLLYFLAAERSRAQSIQQQSGTRPPDSKKLLALRRIQYNVGLIYSALGQSRAAIDRWQLIIDRGGLGADATMQFAILYNIGLLYSQVGQNQNARRNLVQALDLQPNHNGARRALELCLERLKQDQLGPQSQQKDRQLHELPSQSNIGDEQILNYISRQANYHFQRDAKVQQVLRNDW